jgi:hypothetical protein
MHHARALGYIDDVVAGDPWDLEALRITRRNAWQA